jgi:hypothetical protein
LVWRFIRISWRPGKSWRNFSEASAGLMTRMADLLLDEVLLRGRQAFLEIKNDH